MAIYGQEALNNCHHPVEYLVALVQGIRCLYTLLLSHNTICINIFRKKTPKLTVYALSYILA